MQDNARQQDYVSRLLEVRSIVVARWALFAAVISTRSHQSLGRILGVRRGFARTIAHSACVLLFALLVTTSTRSATSSRPVLVVFFPTSVTSSALQRELERGLGASVDVRGYGRFNDFSRAVGDTRPDAILSHETVLQSLGLSVDIHGQLAGERSERLLLVSRSAKSVGIDPLKVRYGIVDLVGRAHLSELVAQFLTLGKPPLVTRVVKWEDLLPVLQFAEAEAVLVPQWAFDEFRFKSQLSFRVVEPPTARLGRLAVSFSKTERSRELRNRILRLPPNVMNLLRIDSWSTAEAKQP